MTRKFPQFNHIKNPKQALNKHQNQEQKPAVEAQEGAEPV